MVCATENAPLNLFEKENAPLILHVYSKRLKLSATWTREHKIWEKHSCLVPGVLFTTKKEATLIARVIIRPFIQKV